ncbi:MAG TPA: aldehyde dehydrogenase family protein [Candidatus Agathobaculum intestinipullorum]|nr:aldehyde dehydrogenase family protein [Candidatus Agathobaculum intestinipullorum]
MNLSDCTKADLLWIIKTMCKYDLSALSLQRALNDLEWEKERDRLARADQALQASSAAYQRYIELIKPYEGMPLTDVPMDVLKQADAAMAESRAANKQWAKLMGVKMK